jgi:hypothetical protein
MSDKDGHPVAQGSGFLVSNDGRVVTNYHVIQHGSSAVIKLPDGAFYVVDGVLAADKVRDVAVIKVHGNNFRTVPLGNSDRLQVGEEVVAIGNPLSLESSVSNGIVSGIRTIEEEGGKLLQITAPISPGSSGGPLFNMTGEVVGITTFKVQGGENLNFAIPINDVKPMLQSTLPKVLTPFPNEQSEPGGASDVAEEERHQPSTGRQYFLELRRSGGISPAYDQVCFDDNESTSFLLLALHNDAINSGKLFVAFYDHGVQTRKEVLGWNSGTNAWEVDISPPTDPDAYVIKKELYELSVEPTTLRYKLSEVVNLSVGDKSYGRESDTTTYELGSGVCESITQPK